MQTVTITIQLPDDLPEERIRTAMRQGFAGLVTEAQAVIREAAERDVEARIAAVSDALQKSMEAVEITFT